MQNDLFQYGGRIYVDSSNVAGAHNGFTWATAFHRLEDALSIAENGDTIWIAKGTYFPTTTSDRNISFVIDKSIGIYSGIVTGATSTAQRTGRFYDKYHN